MRQAASTAPPLPGLAGVAVLQFFLAVSLGERRPPGASRRWYRRGAALEENRLRSSRTNPPIDPSAMRVAPIASIPKGFLVGYRPVGSRIPNLRAGRYSWQGQAHPATIHLAPGFSQDPIAGLTRAGGDLLPTATFSAPASLPECTRGLQRSCSCLLRPSSW